VRKTIYGFSSCRLNESSREFHSRQGIKPPLLVRNTDSLE